MLNATWHQLVLSLFLVLKHAGKTLRMCLVCHLKKQLKLLLGLMELVMTVLSSVSAVLYKGNNLARLKFI